MIKWKSDTYKDVLEDLLFTVPVSTLHHIWYIFYILCTTIAVGVAKTLSAITGNDITQNVKMEFYPFNYEDCDWVDFYCDGLHNMLVNVHEAFLDFIDPPNITENEEIESKDENLK